LYPNKPKYSYNNIDYIELEESITLKYASELLEMDSNELAHLNPMLSKNLIPNSSEKYKLVIPSENLIHFHLKDTMFHDDPYLAEIDKDLKEKIVSKNQTENNGKYSIYVIRSGDNLGYIAQLFGCRISDIKRWNGLNSNFLKVGKKLRIYSNNKHHVANTHTPEVHTGKIGFEPDELREEVCNCYNHEIIPGDNLWDISIKYSSSIETLKKVNNIPKSWKLRLGTFLKIPK